MNNLELSNANGLDESILNANGKFDYLNANGNNQNYYNISAGDVGGFLKDNPDAVKKGLDVLKGLTGKISEARKTGDASLDDACKKPVIPKWIDSGRWKSYDTCVTDFNQRKAAAVQQQRDFELQKAKLEAELASAQARTAESNVKTSQQTTTPQSSGSGKFLGMPKAVGITVTIVGGLALLVGGIFLVRKLRK